MSSSPVHYYILARMSPLSEAGQKNEWSMPGERSPEAALMYFSRAAGLGELQLCGDDDISAEFILEQREVLRSYSGATMVSQPGGLVGRFYVRRHSP
jgi:hypothetical protein